MFTVTMALFAVSFIITGTLLFSFMGRYLSSRYEDELDNIAHQVIDTTLYVGTNRQVPAEVYQRNIYAIAQSTGTEIFVIDAEGDLILTTVEGFTDSIRQIFTKEILSGESATYRGTLGGTYKTDMLTVAKPITYMEKVAGGVLVSIPTPEITRMRLEIIRIFIYNVLIVGLIAAVCIYLYSKRITKPLSQLNEAAKIIAGGDFTHRVQIDADDELAELGETFNHMAESIDQLENMRSSFIANVSHDLRTPMTTITGFVEGIIDGTIPEEKQKWYLSIVLDESKRLSRIVTDLLDLSKLEQGSFKIEPREFDINELIRLTIIKAEKRITEKNIRLTVGFLTEHIMVLADRDAISRVLTNLFDNAIKFTQENGFIDVQAGNKDGKAYISIQNSGMGIEKKELLHIFDRFYKTDKSRSLDKNGAGLGLYIVKSILQAHGENICAESVPGEYTKFSFTLKKSEEKKPDKKQAEENV
ncbi:MAG: HAMP domain-containing protein [Clostridia bacterium]|nr:HAMP domain-containing protein [Clostridia bacterium]